MGKNKMSMILFICAGFNLSSFINNLKPGQVPWFEAISIIIFLIFGIISEQTK